MFRVNETKEQRKQTILKFVEQDVCVGVLLAAANLEWTLKRCILMMGQSPTADLRKMQISSLCSKDKDKNTYKRMWDTEIASPRKFNPLNEVINSGVHFPEEWTVKNLPRSEFFNKKYFKEIRETGWAALQYAFQCRHDLIHGQKGTLKASHGLVVVSVLLEAFDALVDFSKCRGFDLFSGLKSRRKTKTKGNAQRG